MTMTAFQMPFVMARVHRGSSLLGANTSSRAKPVFSTMHLPPNPPTSNTRKDRNSKGVGAWLSGHDDLAVVKNAQLVSVAPKYLFGNAMHVISSAKTLALSRVFLHQGAATAENLSKFAAAGILPIQVQSSQVPSVSETSSLFLQPAASPSFFFRAPVMASAAGAPLLLEKRDKVLSRYFEPEGDSDAALEPEVKKDDRPFVEKVIQWFTRVYLPQGYPHTTTPDYISFTKYRTLQNLASAIMQVISTEALLFGLGLGKKVAAGAAATSWVLKDGASYVAKIGYGSVFGSKFDDDPKSWRIAADIVEDVGGAIEILTPLFPMRYFLPLASLAVCLRGMSAMTGTATRHVVYRSLAASGMQNTGDIATKGESQGVTMKMLGLGAGIVVSSTIGQKYFALLAAYSLLASVHIAANWKSVQCVQFSFFNKQRASLLIDSHMNGEALPNPYDVSKTERIVLPPWQGFEPSVKLGVSVKEAGVNSKRLSKAISMFKGERFIILDQGPKGRVHVLVRDNATNKDILRAYYTVKKYMKTSDMRNGDLHEALKFMRKNIKSFERESVEAGWDLRHMNMTDGQYRVSW